MRGSLRDLQHAADRRNIGAEASLEQVTACAREYRRLPCPSRMRRLANAVQDSIRACGGRWKPRTWNGRLGIHAGGCWVAPGST